MACGCGPKRFAHGRSASCGRVPSQSAWPKMLARAPPSLVFSQLPISTTRNWASTRHLLLPGAQRSESTCSCKTGTPSCKGSWSQHVFHRLTGSSTDGGCHWRCFPVLSGEDWHELLCQGVPYGPGDLTNIPCHGAHSHMIAKRYCCRSHQWARICKKKKKWTSKIQSFRLYYQPINSW